MRTQENNTCDHTNTLPVLFLTIAANIDLDLKKGHDLEIED